MVLPDPKRRGILELLDAAQPLKTPPFQRNFAWELAQVDDYWRDLRRALDEKGGPADYFLGLIVLDDKGHIQDGQQRLAVTLLLSSVIYESVEAAKKSGSHDSQLAIDAAGAVTPALRQSPNAKLEISLQDQDVLMNRAGVTMDAPESTKRLARARSRLAEQASEDLRARTTPDSKLERLRQWAEYLRTGAYVVVLRVPPRDAHNIFETLNTRGVRLSNGDLVKSHLIGRSSNATVAVAKWEKVANTLKDERGRYEDDLESFLLHYFGSRYHRTTKAEFFDDYRREVGQQDVLVVLDELIRNAKIYRALADPAGTGQFWDEIGLGTQHAIQLLNGLGLKQLRYLLLAVLRDLGAGLSKAAQRKRQRQTVLQIASWTVRGLVNDRTGGGEAERTYISAAAAIREGQLKTTNDLRKFLRARKMFISNDELFKSRFVQFPWDRPTSHTRARAILLALELQQVGTKAGLTPGGTLTVEHVLPQSPELGEWTHLTDEQRAVNTYNLGNLLLVDGPSKANDLLGNKEWPAKRAIIKAWGPQTPLTTAALRFTKWDLSTLDRRRESLADIAVQAWRP